LAADTPVFRGGAVVFHSPLAELFEKVMGRERERERLDKMEPRLSITEFDDGTILTGHR